MLSSAVWAPLKNQGRIEVCVNNLWGKVCDDGWSAIDAQVACAQLGFTKTSKCFFCKFINSYCCLNQVGRAFAVLTLVKDMDRL